MAVNSVRALLAFFVLSSLLCEASAATCSNKRTCTERLSRSKREQYSCGWWGLGKCYRYVPEYYNVQKTCYMDEYCTHCQWSDWSAPVYKPCPVKCGGGIQNGIKTRSVKVPAFNGGNSCTESDYRQSVSRNCNTHPCPIHGKWSQWSDYKDISSCSVTCDKGIKSMERNRECNNPSPQYGGDDCKESASETKTASCFEKHCPIDGGWTDYSAFTPWSICSGECDQSRNRNRTCTNPKPQYGGRDCDGESMDLEIRDCFEGECLVESCKSRRMEKDPNAALPRNCKQYVSCSHTNTVMNCSIGTYWDQEKVTCNHKQRVGCDSDKDSEDEPETCQPGELNVDENDPNIFYMCTPDGLLTAMNCPTGLVFKTSSKTCDWPVSS
ncbi:coadhesin-like [Mizuhopecten yessoensis]|uniref:Hemicentin-1 n=1 Tax=Mizuhopecten yessoensis TaxID=6573 RepID=A0A210PZU4_MIZYE|nr:coadhesin-like [Mizuhopecten yessoensis]OWF42002.1 Hemicentin-1 [Mizuhopecten yessoensis]